MINNFIIFSVTNKRILRLLQTNPNPLTLDMSNIGLHSSHCHALFHSLLPQSTLTSLILSGNRIMDSSISHLCSLLNHLSVLRTLDLKCTGITYHSLITLSQCQTGTMYIIHVHVHTYILTYIHTYIHTYMQSNIHIYILTYIHTYNIHTYKHVYMHADMYICTLYVWYIYILLLLYIYICIMYVFIYDCMYVHNDDSTFCRSFYSISCSKS